jgi:hypothetical protein
MSIYQYSLKKNDTGVVLTIKNLEDLKEEEIDLGTIISDNTTFKTQDYFGMIYYADLMIKGTLQPLDVVVDLYGRRFVVMQIDKHGMSN